ncbi:MAG: hypothetical protein QW607_11385 [Desulfurococcaceae archaeon]
MVEYSYTKFLLPSTKHQMGLKDKREMYNKTMNINLEKAREKKRLFLLTLYDYLEETLRAFELACKPGCALCCTSRLYATSVEAEYLPGQFLKIRLLKPSFDLLFPRPFTIHRLEEGKLYILYQIVGRGTKLLSEIKVGESLEVLGPLGKPFPSGLDFSSWALWRELGVAGFGLFLQRLSAEKRREVILYYGARTRAALVELAFFEGFNCTLKVVTEDGTLGYKGFVTELLEEDLKSGKIRSILACGPLSILKRVKELGLHFWVKSYLSLETFLACGTGFCRGCVIPKKGEAIFISVRMSSLCQLN